MQNKQTKNELLWGEKKKLNKGFHNSNSHIKVATAHQLPVTIYLLLLFGADILHILQNYILTII